MLPLLAPVLAQLITLGVQDRSEGRYVVSYDHVYEASTRPGANLSLTWPHHFVSATYAPAFTLTPLTPKSQRELLTYQYLSLNGGYRNRRTTFTVNGDVSFGEINFLVAALQAGPVPNTTDTQDGQKTPTDGSQTTDKPATGTGNGATTGTDMTKAPTSTPPTGQTQTKVERRAVHFITTNARAQLSHTLTKEITVSAFSSYFVAGGLRESERDDYPLIRGTTVGALATTTLPLAKRDSAFGLVNLQQTWSSNGNRVSALLANEGWRHTFGKQTVTTTSAGLSVSRFAQDDGLVAYSVFPNFTAGLGHQMPLLRGTLSLQSSVYSTPALDPLRATIDPRVGFSGGLSWSTVHFSTSLFGNLAISTAPKDANAGAFDTYQASFTNRYGFSKWVSMEAGARMAKQTFQGVSLIPFSYAAFLGLDLSYLVTLHRGR